jgi:hypothetical protein
VLASITPLGERGRANSYVTTAASYFFGSTVGGVALGVLAGWVGVALRAVLPSPSQGTVCVIVGSLSILAAALDLPRFKSLLPSIRRQVNEYWLDELRGPVYGFGFGIQLGFGVVTIVTTASVYLTILLAVVTGSFGWAVVVCGTFGCVRGAMVLLGCRVQTPIQLNQLNRRFVELSARSDRLTRLALLSVAVVSVVVFWSSK